MNAVEAAVSAFEALPVETSAVRTPVKTFLGRMLELFIYPLRWIYFALLWLQGARPSRLKQQPVTESTVSAGKATPLAADALQKTEALHLSDEELADMLVTRAPESSDEDEGASSPRRSIRIRTKHHPDSIKSPTSAAIPPTVARRARHRAYQSRPLLPSKPTRKTLILDLDETLIHSLSKGGKMSSGHMVEVKLGSHAILYYVHKRPHCDLFLQKVSLWYDLVIFTASVQEYADPVIDWLERDRKYFKARYYRQHCTYRFGAYMKDLSVAEKDLGKAIIIDNSPLSYRLNEENAIPIEGWINDPTDNDLLYLLPLLNSLRMLHDVRSLLNLRL